MKMMTKFLPLLIILFLTGCSPSQNSTNSTNLLTPLQPPTPERYQQELEVVRRGSFKKKRLLNRSEEDVYWKLVNYCKERNLKVFAQVSLGEILSADSENYRYINSKRVDFCITNSNLMPVAVVEYQGSGHANSTSEERDAIKREATEIAKMYYIEIHVGSENNISDILNSHFNS